MCVSVFQEHLYVDTLFQDLTKVVLSCFSCRAKKESMSSLIQPCPPSQNKTFTKCRLIYYWSTCPFSFFPFCKMDFGVLSAAVDTDLRCHLFKSRHRSHIATVLYHLVKCPSDLHLLLCIYYFSQRVAQNRGE